MGNKTPANDVIVLDSSDNEEEMAVKKRSRTSTSTTKASADIISNDEHEAPVKGKGKARMRSVVPSSTTGPISHCNVERETAEQTMWCDAYAPTSTADLAPSKTRVQSVRNWMEEALYGRPAAVDGDVPFSKLARDRIRKYRRILVLWGPAGVGKTTTLKIVAKEMNVEVVEWEEGAEEWSMAGQIGTVSWPRGIRSCRGCANP